MSTKEYTDTQVEEVYDSLLDLFIGGRRMVKVTIKDQNGNPLEGVEITGAVGLSGGNPVSNSKGVCFGVCAENTTVIQNRPSDDLQSNSVSVTTPEDTITNVSLSLTTIDYLYITSNRNVTLSGRIKNLKAEVLGGGGVGGFAHMSNAGYVFCSACGGDGGTLIVKQKVSFTPYQTYQAIVGSGGTNPSDLVHNSGQYTEMSTVKQNWPTQSASGVSGTCQASISTRKFKGSSGKGNDSSIFGIVASGGNPGYTKWLAAADYNIGRVVEVQSRINSIRPASSVSSLSSGGTGASAKINNAADLSNSSAPIEAESGGPGATMHKSPTSTIQVAGGGGGSGAYKYDANNSNLSRGAASPESGGPAINFSDGSITIGPGGSNQAATRPSTYDGYIPGNGLANTGWGGGASGIKYVVDDDGNYLYVIPGGTGGSGAIYLQFD